MKIITTRTQPGGDAFVRRLRGLGYDAQCVPVLRAQGLDTPVPDLSRYAGLVITSGHALTHCKITPSDMPVYTVGDATAVLAKDAGWTNVIAGPGNVQLLAGNLKEKGSLLHLCGRDIAADWDGLNVTLCPVYETVPAEGFNAFFQEMDSGVVIVHSARAAAFLRTYVRAYDARMQEGAIIFLCLSRGVLESLTGTSQYPYGAYAANEPTEDALIARLKTL